MPGSRTPIRYAVRLGGPLYRLSMIARDRSRMMAPVLAATLSLLSACVESTPGAPNRSQAALTVRTDTLPVWHLVEETSIGLVPNSGHDFVAPTVLGTDSAGRVYVLDHELLSVRRFTGQGSLDAVLVRSGQGPGELRQAPRTYGLHGETIWFSEAPSGAVHVVGPDGLSRSTIRTGWGITFPVDRVTWVTPTASLEELWIRVENASGGPMGLRPSVRTLLLHESEGVADTVDVGMHAARSIPLDNGRTQIRFPGPADWPVSLFDGDGHVLVVDRPIEPASDVARVRVRRLSSRGQVQTTELALPPNEVLPASRAAMKEQILHSASLGGRRAIEPSVRATLLNFVDEIPARLPAFEVVALHGDGSVWMRLPNTGGGEGFQNWLVLDASLRPQALARAPAHVARLDSGTDGAWWAVMLGQHGVQYVSRLAIHVP